MEQSEDQRVRIINYTEQNTLINRMYVKFDNQQIVVRKKFNFIASNEEY